MSQGKIEQGSDRDLQELRAIWSRFGVDSIHSSVAARLLSERQRQIFSRQQAPVYGLIGTSVAHGNPSIFAAMAIGKPRIISS